jgi:opacity protein-like surface antigen
MPMIGTFFAALRPRALLAITVLVVAPAGGAGQAEPVVQRERSRFSGALALLNTQPLGGLKTGPGVGVDLSAAYALDPAHRFRIRGEFRAAGYGSETRRACLSTTVGCLIELDVDTNYGFLYGGAGPEIAIPVVGSELVLDATAGVGSFTVSSSVSGVSDDEDILSTTNFDDTFFSWSTGGELRIPVSSQLSVAVGGRYQHNGEASYVPEGGITENPDGTVAIGALTSDANMVTLTLGIAFRPFVGWARDDEP